MSAADYDTLTLGPQLGRGGQGAVYPVSNQRINDQWDVVYKEYNDAVRAQADTGALAAMVDAPLNGCFYRVSNTDFASVSSCSQANVIVTGKTSSYSDASSCGSDGWTSWESGGYPDVDYTVCWRNYP